MSEKINLQEQKIASLKEIAKEMNIPRYHSLGREALILAIESKWRENQSPKQKESETVPESFKEEEEEQSGESVLSSLEELKISSVKQDEKEIRRDEEDDDVIFETEDDFNQSIEGKLDVSTGYAKYDSNAVTNALLKEWEKEPKAVEFIATYGKTKLVELLSNLIAPLAPFGEEQKNEIVQKYIETREHIFEGLFAIMQHNPIVLTQAHKNWASYLTRYKLTPALFLARHPNHVNRQIFLDLINSEKK